MSGVGESRVSTGDFWWMAALAVVFLFGLTVVFLFFLSVACLKPASSGPRPGP